jgi:hypothetical protein
VLSKLKKLRNRSFDELRVRGQQSLSAFGERRGWSAQAKLPSDSAFRNLLVSPATASAILEHFRKRSREQFFAGLSDRKATVEILKTRWPESSAAIINQADEVSEGKFRLLGLEGLNFGTPVDWHLDPVSNKRAPLMHWSRMDELDATSFGDQKVVRELSRHQYFITLGQAYWLTGDERYAQTFVDHLTSWIDQNPPKLGTHWTSSLEIAFRSISWLWSFHFFAPSSALTLDVFDRALKVLYLNACHLESYLSTYFSPNTHLTGEGLGLFYVGTLLPQFKDAARWKKKGAQILTDRLKHHVRPDGVYFEQSTYYHRYTVDFYLHFAILLGRNNESVPSDVRERLALLLDHLMYLTRPDGKTPLVGDDDGGWLLPLHPHPQNDFRSSLSVGAVFFNRTDYKFVAGGAHEDVLWLGGPEMLSSLDRLEMSPPAKTSVAFEQGGYYVMREGWSTDSNYLLFDCGPHGTLNCGHAHADALSFELSATGRLKLVDPGTYSYTGDRQERQWFRSSFAHNTVSVDASSSSEPGDVFSWKNIAHCNASCWLSCDRFDYVQGSHDGYQRLPDPVTHSRSVLFLKNDYWVINDRIRSKMQHTADVSFHFAADLSPSVERSASARAFVREGAAENAIEIHTFGNGRWKQENARVSDCYGRKRRSVACVFSATMGRGRDVFSFLLPRVDAGEYRIEEIEATGGRAFRINGKITFDILMILVDGQVEAENLVSNFEVTWARFVERESSRPSEIVAIKGSSIQHRGETIVSFESPVSFATVRRRDDSWVVENLLVA